MTTPKYKLSIDPSKPTVLFVVGGPGAGKGTQCAILKSTLSCKHLSTGDILRGIVEKKSHPKWQSLSETMLKGGLVSSEDLVSFVKAELEPLKGQLVLLDGFPRNQENLEEWNKQKLSEVVNLAGSLYFEVSTEEMNKRLKGRKEGRADDNEEAFKKRIDIFLNTTKPLINSMNNIIRIDAAHDKDTISKQTFAELEKNGIIQKV